MRGEDGKKGLEAARKHKIGVLLLFLFVVLFFFFYLSEGQGFGGGAASGTHGLLDERHGEALVGYAVAGRALVLRFVARQMKVDPQQDVLLRRPGEKSQKQTPFEREEWHLRNIRRRRP